MIAGGYTINPTCAKRVIWVPACGEVTKKNLAPSTIKVRLALCDVSLMRLRMLAF
jgi:hypothetical protein